MKFLKSLASNNDLHEAAGLDEMGKEEGKSEEGRKEGREGQGDSGGEGMKRKEGAVVAAIDKQLTYGAVHDEGLCLHHCFQRKLRFSSALGARGRER